jgi:hypothetical protein
MDSSKRPSDNNTSAIATAHMIQVVTGLTATSKALQHTTMTTSAATTTQPGTAITATLPTATVPATTTTHTTLAASVTTITASSYTIQADTAPMSKAPQHATTATETVTSAILLLRHTTINLPGNWAHRYPDPIHSVHAHTVSCLPCCCILPEGPDLDPPGVPDLLRCQHSTLANFRLF